MSLPWEQMCWPLIDGCGFYIAWIHVKALMELLVQMEPLILDTRSAVSFHRSLAVESPDWLCAGVWRAPRVGILARRLPAVWISAPLLLQSLWRLEKHPATEAGLRDKLWKWQNQFPISSHVRTQAVIYFPLFLDIIQHFETTDTQKAIPTTQGSAISDWIFSLAPKAKRNRHQELVSLRFCLGLWCDDTKRGNILSPVDGSEKYASVL